MTGFNNPEAENPVEFPVMLYDLWQMFLKLHRSRERTMDGPCRITEQNMGWFFHNRGIQPESWMLDAIYVLDTLALGSLRENDEH